MLRYLRVLVPAILLIAGCTGNESTNNQDESGTSVANAPAATTHEFDILEQCDLRSGPGIEHPRKVNQKASDLLGEIHYLSVDSSVTVTILATQGDWAEIQVTQPDHLRASHGGWVPKKVVKYAAATNKVDGWIRHGCPVYRAPNASTKPVGYLSPPSSVGVADDSSGWLRLIHGPIKDEATNQFLDAPKFQEVFTLRSPILLQNSQPSGTGNDA